MKTKLGRPKVEAERREQILSAFETCVIEYGLGKTTLQKVANQAGLPRSLVRYFVGNKEDMIQLLLDRMIERAERSLSEQYPRNPTLAELLDFLFDGAFSNDTSNLIVGQLWEISSRDDNMKKKLNGLYTKLKKKITSQMHKEGLPNAGLHADLAQSLIALAYGEACFVDIGMKTKKRDASRMLANLLVQEPGET